MNKTAEQNSNLQGSKSPPIIGRKISNVYSTLKKQRTKKLPNIVLLPLSVKKADDTSRTRPVKRVGCRSLSLNKIFPDKISKPYMPHYVSPPHRNRIKKKKINQISQIVETDRKIEKNSSHSMKNILTESLLKIQIEKEMNLKKELEERMKKETRREKVKFANEKIRKKNLRAKKILDFKHPRPWGSDQRHFKDFSEIKSPENEEIRNKIRAEREMTKKEGRKAIGLDFFSNIKLKSKNLNKSEEKTKLKRSPDPNILEYIKKKKEGRKLALLKIKLAEALKEKERVQALERLEKTQRKKHFKKKKKKKTKSVWIDNEKSTEITQPLYRNQKKTINFEKDLSHRKESPEPTNILSEKIKVLKQRVHKTQDLVRNEAALTIQKWFRSIKNKLSRSHSLKDPEKQEWINFFKITNDVPLNQGDLVEKFKEKLNKKSEIAENIAIQAKNPLKTDENSEKTPLNSSDAINSSTSNKPKVVYKVHPLSLGRIIMNTKLKSGESLSSNSLIYDSLQNSLEFMNKNTESLQSSSYDQENSRKSGTPTIPEKKISIINEVVRSDQSGVSSSQNSLHTFKYHNESPKNSDDYFSVNVISDSYQGIESNLKSFLHPNDNSKESDEIDEVNERPLFKLISDSDSSEEEWNSNLVIYADSNISEQQLEEKVSTNSEFFRNFEAEITDLISKEVDLFVESIPFKISEKDVDPSADFIKKYIQNLYQKMKKNEEEMLEIINTPSYQDPLTKLSNLQTIESGHLNKFPSLELLLPSELSISLKLEFKAIESQSRQIYLQMLFDCVNEVLNYVRPFGTRGLPDPWNYTLPTLFGEGQLQNVFDKISLYIHKWSSVKSGSYPDENTKSDDDKLQRLREERLSHLLTQNIKDEEKIWLQYEDEETQVKIDVCDTLMDLLVEETIDILKQNIYYNYN
jgi:Domain of unknown function (DUF4378)